MDSRAAPTHSISTTMPAQKRNMSAFIPWR
jgi:hypothetical protein